MARLLSSNTKAGIEFVAEKTRAQFARQENGSNEYFDVFTNVTPIALEQVSSVEARLNRQTGAVKIYVMRLKTGRNCLRPKTILSQLGSPQDISVSPPRNPPSVPNYYKYKFSSGEVRFGITKEKPACCSTVVIEFAV
jgi:hypothetical protein